MSRRRFGPAIAQPRWVKFAGQFESEGVGMRYHVLATDYDGTIADDGTVNAQTVEALKRFRSVGADLWFW